MKIKLFTHIDLDGVGCAILAYLAFGRENVDVEYCDYKDIDTKVRTFWQGAMNANYDAAYVTDVSISDDLAHDIDTHTGKNKWKLLDHHQTALYLNKYDWCNVCVYDNENIATSGTMMFYQWLNINHNNVLENNQVIKNFAELVRNYDTWRWTKLGEEGKICKSINDLLYLYGRERFVTWCISEIHDKVFPRLYAADNLVLTTHQKEINTYIEEKEKQIFTSSMCGKVCGFVFADRYISELGNKLCAIHPEIDFVAIIDMGNQRVSYRTIKDDIDLGRDVAALFGGGGHQKAAGSNFDATILPNVVKEIF